MYETVMSMYVYNKGKYTKSQGRTTIPDSYPFIHVSDSTVSLGQSFLPLL